MSICNIVAILTSVDKSGWATLEHHLDIVDGFFPNWLRQPFTRLLFLYKNYFEAIYIFHISKTVKHNAKLFIFVENKNHSHFLFCALIYINATLDGGEGYLLDMYGDYCRKAETGFNR